MRANSADRDRCTAVLAEGYAAGFLDDRTFEARLDRALTVMTRAELAALVADLPVRPIKQVQTRKTTSRGGRPGGLTRRAWVATGGLAVALTVAGGLIQTGAPPEAAARQVCLATGVAVPENETCPEPTRAQKSLQTLVDRADAAAEQASAAAEGATEGSRLRDLAREADTASGQARSVQAQAQEAWAGGDPNADEVVATAVMRAKNATKVATRAAIEAGQEAAQ
ncbi:DUF1707 SHOCT-like domain-containing protein [Nocardioides aurantiacus]